MASLDRYLVAMAQHRADALIFSAAAPISMVLKGANKPVSSQPTTEKQILTLLHDALGAAFTPGLSGVRSFPYDSPSGPVTITVDESTGLDVRISPRFGDDNPTPAPELIDDPPSRPTPIVSRAVPPPPPSFTPEPLPTPAPILMSPSGFAAGPTGGFATLSSGPAAARVGGQAMNELFHKMLDMKASDLHLKSNNIPMVRIDGSMREMPGRPRMSSEQLTRMVETIMPERNLKEFAETNDTDFAYELSGRARMRCNVFRDLAGVGAVFRQIPTQILTVEQLGLPKAVIEMCGNTKGLVVVTGPTGSGKSTTLAAMVDWINKNRDDHIITIEDPVEFVHKDIKCLVNQREIGVHTKGFKSALRAALREDPDIVLVGEMRDLETVAIAIETAETGHLVFGTLHTNTAPSTVDRLIDQFPTDRQQQIRLMLSESLRGVVAQILLKKKGGGRVAALEILIVTRATANLIREGKTFQIPSVMQTGRGLGMQTMSDSLMELVKKDVVEPAEAFAKAPQKKEFAAMLTAAGIKGPWSAIKDDA